MRATTVAARTVDPFRRELRVTRRTPFVAGLIPACVLPVPHATRLTLQRIAPWVFGGASMKPTLRSLRIAE